VRVIIAGSRSITDQKVVLRAIRISNQVIQTALIDTVLSGGALGVDQIGEFWAYDNGLEVERHPADWKKWGNAAGMRRNAHMAKHADGLIAVWDGKSNGTLNMIQNAIDRDLAIYIHGTINLKDHIEGYEGPCSCRECLRD
jgi:hypothetical protein